jgi:hypothetical protein
MALDAHSDPVELVSSVLAAAAAVAGVGRGHAISESRSEQEWLQEWWQQRVVGGPPFAIAVKLIASAVPAASRRVVSVSVGHRQGRGCCCRRPQLAAPAVDKNVPKRSVRWMPTSVWMPIVPLVRWR